MPAPYARNYRNRVGADDPSRFPTGCAVWVTCFDQPVQGWVADAGSEDPGKNVWVKVFMANNKVDTFSSFWVWKMEDLEPPQL